MKAWRLRSEECVFCAFRRSSTPPRNTLKIKSFSTNTGPSLQQGAYKTLDPRPDGQHSRNNRKRQQIPRIDSANPQRGDGRGSGVRRLLLEGSDGRPLIRRESLDRGGNFVHKSDLAELSKLPDVIRENLKTLEHRLQKHKPDKSDRTQMDLLDPTQKFWPAFKTLMLSVAKTSAAGTLSASDKVLYTQLSKSYLKKKTGFETELYFAFLDFALKPLDTNDMTASNGLLVDLRYPTEWYVPARKHQRVIHLHVGPTNSGKTYNALKRLQEAESGFYAGPLRLLAHEVYSRFQAKGIHCDLITGDDMRLDESATTTIYASTVEMVMASREVEVAVIDEIQMMGHEERGWAWTRAFLGANAKEVHLCGEERVTPLVRQLAASMGDTLHVHRYERLNPLKCMSTSFRGDLKMLEKGDCIVAFSVMQIHALKQQIEIDTGRRCAIVYGSLPPETRAEQADLFNDPDNDYDYLVASDAIGMGLNLSIKRIIFNKVTRWDGTKTVTLSIPQIKQIAGRAGRFKSSRQANDDASTTDTSPPSTSAKEQTVGWVTCIDEADLPIIHRALKTEAPPLLKTGLMPPAEFLEEYSRKLPLGIPFEYLMRKVCFAATIHSRFFLCDIRDKLAVARIVDEVPGLSVEQRVNISAAPLGRREPKLDDVLRAIARAIAKFTPITITDLKEIPLETLTEEPRQERAYLTSLEILHHSLILYLWLSYRFPSILRDQPMAKHAKELTEQKINWTLRAFSANPALQARLKSLREQKSTPTVDESLENTTTDMLEETERSEEATGMEDVEGVNAIQRLVDDETLDEHFAIPGKHTSEFNVPGEPANPDGGSYLASQSIVDRVTRQSVIQDFVAEGPGTSPEERVLTPAGDSGPVQHNEAYVKIMEEKERLVPSEEDGDGLPKAASGSG